MLHFVIFNIFKILIYRRKNQHWYYWQARGDRFESDILHNINFKSINFIIYRLFLFLINHLLDKNTLIQNMSEKKITAENAKFFTLSFFIKKHKVHKAFY